MDERPRINLKLEVLLPDPDGGPSKKFCVSRPFKARWSSNPGETMVNILSELKDYRGSYIGDMMVSLSSIVLNEEKMTLPENKRALEVDRWASSLLEKLIYSSIQDKIHRTFMKDFSLQDWDGTMTEVEPVTSEELKHVDADRISLLLGPKLKHALEIISKDLRKNTKK